MVNSYIYITTFTDYDFAGHRLRASFTKGFAIILIESI